MGLWLTISWNLYMTVVFACDENDHKNNKYIYQKQKRYMRLDKLMTAETTKRSPKKEQLTKEAKNSLRTVIRIVFYKNYEKRMWTVREKGRKKAKFGFIKWFQSTTNCEVRGDEIRVTTIKITTTAATTRKTIAT